MEQFVLIMLFFLTLLTMGVVLCLIPMWIMGRSKKPAYNRAALIKGCPVAKAQKTPDVGKELNIIPIEEAMAVSSNVEKRTLLLEQLKKGEVTYLLNNKTIGIWKQILGEDEYPKYEGYDVYYGYISCATNRGIEYTNNSNVYYWCLSLFSFVFSLLKRCYPNTTHKPVYK